jgi:DNA-binding PadR family transcriptional regulator
MSRPWSSRSSSPGSSDGADRERPGLVDVEKVASELGPPRKVYSLNAQGQEYLEEFWRTWSFLVDSLTAP